MALPLVSKPPTNGLLIWVLTPVKPFTNPPERSQARKVMTSAIEPENPVAGAKNSRVAASAARRVAKVSVTGPTSFQEAPASVENQSRPPERLTPVRAMPGRPPDVEEKLLSAPPSSMRLETRMLPAVLPATGVPLPTMAKAGDLAASRRGRGSGATSLTSVTLIANVFSVVKPPASVERTRIEKEILVS